MKKGFTLVELLVIIGIMAAMVTASVISVRSGQGAARVRGATRDIFALIRHARSIALLSQQPAILTYSSEMRDGEVVTKVEITSTKMLDTTSDRGEIQTLSGEPLKESRERVHIEDEGGDAIKSESDGQGVEDILFAPVSEDVVRGMRIKVTVGDEQLEALGEEKAKSKLSVFSNVDYLMGKFNKAKSEKAKKDESVETGMDEKIGASAETLQEPVSVVWETNGRVEPHRIWVYADGSTPEKGLSIKIDRYGAAKVLGEGEDEE